MQALRYGKPFIFEKVEAPTRLKGNYLVIRGEDDEQFIEGVVNLLRIVLKTRRMFGKYLLIGDDETQFLADLITTNVLIPNRPSPPSGRNNEVFFIACHPHFGGHRSIATLG